MTEQLIGSVVHYYAKPSVAGIVLSGDLAVGDTIRIKGHTTDFTQPVDSMQIEHEVIERASSGDDVGVKVADRVRLHDEVFLVD